MEGERQGRVGGTCCAGDAQLDDVEVGIHAAFPGQDTGVETGRALAPEALREASLQGIHSDFFSKPQNIHSSSPYPKIQLIVRNARYITVNDRVGAQNRKPGMGEANFVLQFVGGELWSVGALLICDLEIRMRVVGYLFAMNPVFHFRCRLLLLKVWSSYD